MAGGTERASAAVLDREGCGDNLLGKYGDGADACTKREKQCAELAILSAGLSMKEKNKRQ